MPLLPNYQPKPDDVPTDASAVEGTKASNDFRVAVLDVGVEPLPASYTLEAAGYDRQKNEAQYVTAFRGSLSSTTTDPSSLTCCTATRSERS